MTKPHEILKFYLERKKVSKPGFSLRLIARELGVSPAYVSNIFRGKKGLPRRRLARLFALLEMDDIARLQLKSALDPEDAAPRSTLTESDQVFLRKYKTLEQCKYDILRHWYNIALLDLTNTKGFESDPDWIAQRLGIQRLEVELAIRNLKAAGLLEENNGQLKKKDKHRRFPAKVSALLVRSYHKQMIQKALEDFETKPEEHPVEKRLLAGATIALHTAAIRQAKEDAQLFLYRSAEKYSVGDCEHLYQMNVQFFPLTKREPKGSLEK